MDTPKAIGFDLFNTLLTIHPRAMEEAQQRLIDILHEVEIPVEATSFRSAYVEAAKRFIKETRKDGRETHNRFWIAAALENLGYCLPPDDPRIAKAVDAYFSAFYPNCRLIPGTKEMLEKLAQRFRLGLLTNFTHPPAVRRILDLLELPPFFHTVLVSGELGFRKPHSSVFDRFAERLGMQVNQVLFVGDDPEADIQGALQAGLRPVWTTYVLDANIPSAQTLLSPSRDHRPSRVPCISNWQDLFSLLED